MSRGIHSFIHCFSAGRKLRSIHVYLFYCRAAAYYLFSKICLRLRWSDSGWCLHNSITLDLDVLVQTQRTVLYYASDIAIAVKRFCQTKRSLQIHEWWGSGNQNVDPLLAFFPEMKIQNSLAKLQWKLQGKKKETNIIANLNRKGCSLWKNK